MLGKLGTKLAARLLKTATLTVEERQLLTAAVLERLGALPVRDKIVVDENGIFVDGRQVNLETAKRLKEGSVALLKNFARKFVGEQVRYMAIVKGVHENTSPEQGLFAKAALWVMQEEEKLYRAFAQDEGNDDLNN